MWGEKVAHRPHVILVISQLPIYGGGASIAGMPKGFSYPAFGGPWLSSTGAGGTEGFVSFKFLIG